MERSGCYEKNGSHEFIDAIDGCWKFQLRLRCIIESYEIDWLQITGF